MGFESSLRSALMGYFNAEAAEIRRGPQREDTTWVFAIVSDVWYSRIY